MKSRVFTMFAAVAVAGTMLAAQDPQPTPDSPASPASPAATTPRSQSPSTTPSASQSQDQSLTGCLVQGSGPSVFLLEHAKSGAGVAVSSPSSQTDRSVASSAGASKTYVVTASAGSVDLKGQLNHQVTITGMGDAASVSAPAAGQSAKVSEKDLPKFSAKTIMKIADTCSSAG